MSKAGDTIYSVSESQTIATDTLLNSNGLSYDEGTIPTGTSLCIASTCEVHVLKNNETCDGIASNAGISSTQLQSWNTNINPLCTNLDRFVNGTFCISNPVRRSPCFAPLASAISGYFQAESGEELSIVYADTDTFIIGRELLYAFKHCRGSYFCHHRCVSQYPDLSSGDILTVSSPEPTNVGQNTTTDCGRFYEGMV